MKTIKQLFTLVKEVIIGYWIQRSVGLESQIMTLENQQISQQDSVNNKVTEANHQLGNQINTYLNHYIAVADAKAGAILGSNIVLATVIVVQKSNNTVSASLLFLTVTLFALSTLFCILVIYPRLPRGKKGILFWEDIRTYDSVDQYAQKILTLSKNDVERAYALQNFLVSDVLHQKHKWLRWGMWIFILAIFFSIITYGLY